MHNLPKETDNGKRDLRKRPTDVKQRAQRALRTESCMTIKKRPGQHKKHMLTFLMYVYIYKAMRPLKILKDMVDGTAHRYRKP